MNGHWWPDYRLDGTSRLGRTDPRNPVQRRLGVFAMTLQCRREVDGEGCGVERTAYLNGDYTPNKNAYKYPNNYFLPNALPFTKARRGRVRLELDIRAGEAA